MSINWREKVLLFKTEVTYGTDPVPTGAANAFMASDIKLMPMEGRDQERDVALPTMGANPTLPVDLHCKMTFKVEATPSGVAGTPPAWGPLLRACGVSQVVVGGTSVTYNPSSGPHDAVTGYLYIGQTLYKLLGTRGNAVYSVSAQGIVYWEFEVTGLFVLAAESTRPTPVLSAFPGPLAATAANTPVFTINAIALVLRSLKLNFGNEVKPRFLIGSHQVKITDRSETIEMVVEAEPVSLINPYTLALNQTKVPIVLNHGTIAGARIKLNAPLCQIQRPSGVNDQDGIVEWPISAVPQQNAGNDQWTILLD